MNGPGRDGHPASAQLLIDLVTDTLDPGYAAAAQRRGGQPATRWYDRPLVALGALLVGFVLVVAYVHAHRGAPAAQRVHDSLVQRVRDAQQNADKLAGQVDESERALAAEQAKALPASGSLARSLALRQLAAGNVAVEGPGIAVTLSNPPGQTPSSVAGQNGPIPLARTNTLTDRDVRSVVNQLWSDGAEAVAVNGIRLTAGSAIRFAGQAVLVDFQPVTAPYRIEAIGGADDLSTAFAQSGVASRYQTLESAEGIGFSFETSDHLTFPAGTPASVRYATPEPSRSGR